MELAEISQNSAGVSFPFVRTFSFTPQEIIQGDLSRYRACWNVERIRKLRGKAKLVGDVTFNVAKLLGDEAVLMDSPEFVNFCRNVRSDGSFAALSSLATPDYALVICAGSQDASFIRRSEKLTVVPSVHALRVEIARDLERGEKYAISAGLHDRWSTIQFGGIRRYVRNYYWKSS